jgi:hypothetical protein
VRLGSRSKVLPECALPTVKFAVYFVVSGPGKAIALQAPREKVEVDMRHGLPRRATVLRGPIPAPDISKRNKNKKERDDIYLTCDREPIRLVCALLDASDVLDRTHELGEFVRAQIGEARDGAHRAHEHVWKGGGSYLMDRTLRIVDLLPRGGRRVEKRKTGVILLSWGDMALMAGATHVRPGTIGFRLTIA